MRWRSVLTYLEKGNSDKIIIIGKKTDSCKDAAGAVDIIDAEWLMRYDKRIQPLSLWGGECNRISGE